MSFLAVIWLKIYIRLELFDVLVNTMIINNALVWLIGSHTTALPLPMDAACTDDIKISHSETANVIFK